MSDNSYLAKKTKVAFFRIVEQENALRVQFPAGIPANLIDAYNSDYRGYVAHNSIWGGGEAAMLAQWIKNQWLWIVS